MRVFQPTIYVGPNRVELLGDDRTGALVFAVNEHRYSLPRDNTAHLVEQLADHLAATADCPRCGHGRREHFQLFTFAGYLYGCSHGTVEGQAHAAGLPCDSPGIPQ
jgi:hypothetical protein